jgi:ssDNA-binding Zn-finger/Zn-ribbon topoisomerase 1
MKRLAIARVSKKDFLMSGTPREFEDTVAAMFQKLGYSVKQTPYSSDGGKDAIATKDDKKVLIECKRYEKDLIGRPALQKFYAAIMEEKADKGIFITTSGFARTALDYEFVGSNLIELIDGTALADMMIRAFPESSDSEKYAVMCPQCGSQVMFDLLAGEFRKKCPNNHPVNNDLQSGMLSIKLVSGKLYCDRCGREMRRVHGRRGDFWGCSGYPKCRSIMRNPPK